MAMKRRKRSKTRPPKRASRKVSATTEELPSTAADARQFFVDPASISTGWALYQGKKLIDHGTIRADKSFPVFSRLHVIWAAYRELPLKNIDSVHIEQLPRMCHHYTHHSVGVIGHALYKFCADIAGDIPVKSWQKFTGWDGKYGDKYATIGPTFLHVPASEDERAAIAMGWYMVNK